MKKKVIIVIIFVILLILFSSTGYDRGTKIEILGKEVFNNIIIAEPTTINKVENYQKYSKIVDNICLEFNIPNEWKYEELPQNSDNDFYKYALKLYKNSEEQYAVLYFYNNPFGVCGTGRSSERIILNNGDEATIGYYDRNTNWSDISFFNINKYIAVINYGLIGNEAKEVIDFMKSINVIEEDEERHEFVGTIIEASDTYIVVEPDEGTNERNSSDKISMGITRPTNGINDFYVKGNKVKITYNGLIMESYPAQIVATKIELENNKSK